MKIKKIPELLSPVGTKESVYSAVNSGCDAIYLGGKNFNARKYATNFSDEELNDIIDFCHIRGVKVLITINTLYKNNEINNVLKFVSDMYSAGADAFIIQDIGIFNILKSSFPMIRLHASTQMTAHNIETVKFLNNVGFSRVVLSRELSLEEIKEICERISIETEIFIHGALCVSYSGRCLMSSILGKRSGNRGQCAQPCRLRYSLYKNNKKIVENYLISPKDIMTLGLMDKLTKIGICSFKIEGRMKSPEYVAQATKTYRKYIDLSLENKFHSSLIDTNDIEKLTQIFNRGGDFSSGYLINWSGKEMISSSPKSSGIKIGIIESYNKNSQKAVIALSKSITAGDGIEIWTEKEPHIGTGISKSANAGDKVSIKIKGNIKKGNIVYKSYDKLLNDELKKDYQNDIRKREVYAYITAKLNTPLKIKVSCKEASVELKGTIVQSAEKKPITEEELIKRISKTGNTPFKLNIKEIILDKNIYIPISEINLLRRKALSILSDKIVKSYKREKIKISYSPKIINVSEKKEIAVHLGKEEHFYSAIKYKISRIYFEFNELLIKNFEKYVKEAHKNDIEFFVCFPIIYRKNYFNKFNELFNKFEKSDIDGYLLRNFQELNTRKKLVSDYTFNVLNSASIEFMSNFFDTVTLSPELTLSEIKETASEKTEIFIYGRLILMTTHQCPIGLYDAKKTTKQFCKLKNSNDIYYIKDRLGINFPVERDCETCTAFILNSLPICILNKINELIKSQISSRYFRIALTDESTEMAEDIIYSHIKILNLYEKDKNNERVGNTIQKIKEIGCTTGHLFTGVK